MGLSKNRKLSNLLDKDTGLVKSTLSDSDQIVASGSKGIASASAATTVYSALENLPGSATTGDQAFVSSNNGLYIYNGSGWYKVALVNATPYWITQPESSYTLNTNGTATVITVNAGDSDGHSITYTATPDSDANLIATVTKDSDNGRIFSIIPIDSDNSASQTEGSGTITFKASDGINQASKAVTINYVVYSSKIASESTAPFIYFSFKEQIGTDANGTLYSSFVNQGSGGSTYDLGLHTSANRPEADTDATITGGTKALSFNSNDNLRFNNYAMPGSWTFVFIGHCSSTRLIAFGGKNNPTFLGYYQANNTGVLARNEQDVGMTQSSLSSTSTMKTFVVRLDGDTLDYWDNSSTKVNYSTTFYTNNFNIGCVGGRQYSGSVFQPSVGYLGDIAIYNTALSDADCAAMAAALNTKYNV